MARKPGKYEHLTANLPRISLVEPERRTVIDIVKAEILAPVPSEMEFPASLIQDNVSEMGDILENLLILLKVATGGRRYASEFIRVYAEIDRIKDKMAEWQSDIQLLLDAYTELMLDQMEVEGIKSQQLRDGSSLSTFLEPYPKVADKEIYRLWCIKQGLEKEMHLWPSKTAALVKQILLSGEAEPPGIEVYSLPRVRFSDR